VRQEFDIYMQLFIRRKIITKCTTTHSTSKFAVIKMLFALACYLFLLVSVIFLFYIFSGICLKMSSR